MACYAARVRRVCLEAGAVYAAAFAFAAAWLRAPFDDGSLVGSSAAGWAWRVAHLQAVLAGRSSLGVDGELAVPLAGWPLAGLTAGLCPSLADGRGGSCLSLTLTAWFALGPALLWVYARARGAGAWSAALVAAVGGTSTLALRSLADGSADGLAVPLVVAVLVLRGVPTLTLPCVALLACFDGRQAAVAAWCAAVAAVRTRGAWAWLVGAGVVAAATGARPPQRWGVLDPLEAAAPLIGSDPAAVGLGIAALALFTGLAAAGGAAAAGSPPGRQTRGGDSPPEATASLRDAAVLAWALSFGPILRVLSEPVTMLGGAVPLPGIVLGLFDPGGVDTAQLVLVAHVAVALALAEAPRTSRWLVAALLVVAALEGSSALDGPVPRRGLAPSLAEQGLRGGTGAVLSLPLEVEGDATARGVHALYLLRASAHGRAVAVGALPLASAHPLFADPGVAASVALARGDERAMLPPTPPGAALAGLGVTRVLVHRALYDASALARLDPLLTRLWGPPQRDLVGAVDVYAVPDVAPVRAVPVPLRRAGDPDAAGWRTLAESLGRPPRRAGGGAGRSSASPTR